MSKIQTLCTTLEANGFDVQWYNTGGGCMCVRIQLGDDQKDWSDILIGEGDPAHGGPDSFGYADLEDDQYVSGVWFASASSVEGEAIEEPVMMRGDTDDLLEAVRVYILNRR